MIARCGCEQRAATIRHLRPFFLLAKKTHRGEIWCFFVCLFLAHLALRRIVFFVVGSVAVSGSPKRWDRWHSPSPNWQEKYHLYTTYILPSGGLYATYHLLGEPETTIDWMLFFNFWAFGKLKCGLFENKSPKGCLWKKLFFGNQHFAELTILTFFGCSVFCCSVFFGGGHPTKNLAHRQKNTHTF